MADAQILEASGTNSSSSTTYVDVCEIAAASFTAGAKYLILAFAQGQIASSANDLRLRLVRGETPTEFTDALDDEEIVANTTHTAAQWMTVYTQPGTTERIRVQVATQTGTLTATCEYAHIIAINLDDIGTEDTDYWYTEDTADASITLGGIVGASQTWTANGTSKYLMLGQAAWIPGSATLQSNIQIELDSVGVGLVSEEGEDTTNERRNRIIVWAATPSAASHTFRVLASSESSDHGTLLSSRVFILDLSKFAQADINVSSGTTALTEGAGWINLATLSVTPDATGDFVLLGGMIQDWNAATNAQPEGRLQVNPDGGGLVSRPAYGDDGLGADTWDGTDQRSLVLFDVVSLTSGASRTINLDARMANVGTSDPQVFHRALVYFSKALAATTPPRVPRFSPYPQLLPR